MTIHRTIRWILIITIAFAASVAWAKSPTEEKPEEKDITGPIGEYKEAPMLAELVANGELPPVEERLPDEPLVVETISEIGKYGGQLRLYGDSVWNMDLHPSGMWGFSLFRVPRSGIGNDPNIAAGYEVSDDQKVITVYLRPGAKWSDGHPFTTEDIRFQYDNMHNRKPKEVSTWGATGRIQETEVIDDYTIKLICPGGVGTTLQALSNWNGSQSNAFTAAHYLKKWHLDFNPDAGKVAKEEGYDQWYEAFNAHAVWYGSNLDLDLPKMTPWLPVQQTTTTELHERNPYYVGVDAAGNQLPYVDSAIVQIVDPEVYQLKVSGGEADFAWAGLSFGNIGLYMSNAESGNYRVDLHPGALGNKVALCPANWYYDESERELWRNIKFRQALSVAVDREDINEAIYLGYGVPRQSAPLPSTSFYKEEWGTYYAQYDPALANELLDEVGLDKKNAEGYRLKPDGRILSIVLQPYVEDDVPTLELVREYWEAVGLKTTIKFGDVGLVEERLFNNEVQIHVKFPAQPPASDRASFEGIWVWHSINNYGAFDEWLTALSEHLGGGQTESALLPEDWRFSEVSADVAAGFPGVEPDDAFKQALTNEDLWQKTEMGSPEYIRIAQELFDYYVFNLHHIGFVGMVPSPIIVHNRIGNAIPPGWVNGFVTREGPYIGQWMDQIYIKE
jgi:peptide/nickel transport system substrate-binding protein